jgi:hypothetical protein
MGKNVRSCPLDTGKKCLFIWKLFDALLMGLRTSSPSKKEKRKKLHYDIIHE